jgi:hypothetical protein
MRGHACVCVCVYVRERERERESPLQTLKEIVSIFKTVFKLYLPFTFVKCKSGK